VGLVAQSDVSGEDLTIGRSRSRSDSLASSMANSPGKGSTSSLFGSPDRSGVS
jgi:hypothetical protein